MFVRSKREVPTRGYIGGLMALLLGITAVFLNPINKALFWSAVVAGAVGVPIILLVWWRDRHQIRE